MIRRSPWRAGKYRGRFGHLGIERLLEAERRLNTANGLQIVPNGAATPRRVVLVGYLGAQALDLTGPLEVFSMFNKLGEAKAYDIVPASPTGGEIVCNSGVRLAGSSPWPSCPARSTRCWSRAGLAVGPQGLRRRPAGVAVLAARPTHRQRLLRESPSWRRRDPGPRRATTHWGFSDAFRAFRPAAARSGRDLHRRSAALHLGREL